MQLKAALFVVGALVLLAGVVVAARERAGEERQAKQASLPAAATAPAGLKTATFALG